MIGIGSRMEKSVSIHDCVKKVEAFLKARPWASSSSWPKRLAKSLDSIGRRRAKAGITLWSVHRATSMR